MDQKKPLGYEIHTLDKMIGRRLGMFFEEHNISMLQSWIIRRLYEQQDEHVYQKDLEGFFHIARSTATEALQGLEKQGYLTRCSVPGDARLKRLVLTEKGIALQMAVFDILKNHEENLRKDISEEDLAIFYRVLERMKENVSVASSPKETTP